MVQARAATTSSIALTLTNTAGSNGRVPKSINSTSLTPRDKWARVGEIDHLRGESRSSHSRVLRISPLEMLTANLDDNLACSTGFNQRMRSIDVRRRNDAVV